MGLVRELVRLRLDEISDVADGRRFDFYATGAVKAVGSMRDGQQNGQWKWYRQDGTLMRAGQFTGGKQNGIWRTYDRDSQLVRTTEF